MWGSVGKVTFATQQPQIGRSQPFFEEPLVRDAGWSCIVQAGGNTMALVILSIIAALVTLAAATAGLLISAQAEVDSARSNNADTRSV